MNRIAMLEGYGYPFGRAKMSSSKAKTVKVKSKAKRKSKKLVAAQKKGAARLRRMAKVLGKCRTKCGGKGKTREQFGKCTSTCYRKAKKK